MSNPKRSFFSRFSSTTAKAAGHPLTFLASVLVVIIWAVLGPVFRYSDTWQLVINTGTTVITFLMVFVIQNSQNRDSAAIQLKLDDLIESVEKAHNDLIGVENEDEDELERRREKLRLQAAAEMPFDPSEAK